MACDRGLAYGDGIYRTLECCTGSPRHWRYHYACLCRDAAQLGLRAPAEASLLDEIYQVTASCERAVVKVVLTRGSATRGYAISNATTPTRIVAATCWAGYPEVWRQQGITMRLCETRLALQPRLAGIKHLNRLENVLASSEWTNPTIQEGLMLDMENFVVAGTKTNLFIVRAGQLTTPLLDRCGVSGALRAWVLDCYAVVEARLRVHHLLTADEVFVGNSLAGVWPVVRLLGHSWDKHPLSSAISERFNAAQ